MYFFTSKFDNIHKVNINVIKVDHVINGVIIGIQYSTFGCTFIIIIIPHTTKVAACINADTGIGPSIASGNHICKPNWVDFVNAHITINVICIEVVIVSHSNAIKCWYICDVGVVVIVGIYAELCENTQK